MVREATTWANRFEHKPQFAPSNAPSSFGSAAISGTGPEFNAFDDSNAKPEFAKRALDITGSILALILASPAILVAMTLIRLLSPGASIFRQTRVGKDGKTFECYKLRTMRPNAPTSQHTAYIAELMNADAPMVKLDRRGDSRLIPFGGILRASGIDELPQLVNVLKGEMSLVGPRPCTVSEFELYTSKQKQRFQVKPGLTGLWQVSGKNDTTFSQMINLDLEYCEEWDLKMDLAILSKTWKVVVRQLKEHLTPSRSRLTTD